MIINLAGFRVGIYPVAPKKEVRLRDQLLHCQTCLPAQFHLRVHFSNRPLFQEDAAALRVGFTTRQENDPCQPAWTIQYIDSRVRIKGWSDTDHTLPDWEMILDSRLSTGVLNHSGGYEISDALIFPIDQILIYYLTIWNQAVIIHGSAISFQGEACFFFGRSGTGKSTLARWCQAAGAEIIHDDKIVLRLEHEGVGVYSIPWGEYHEPRQATLTCGFTLEHGSRLVFEPWNEIDAFDQLLEHVVFYPMGREVIQRQFKTISSITRQLPLQHMRFPKNPDIVSTIRSMMPAKVTHET